MRVGRGRVLIGALASLLWLSGCETATKLSDLLPFKNSADPPSTAQLPGQTEEPATTGRTGGTDATGTVAGAPPPGTAAPGMLGSDVYDDLNMGKKFYSTGNYGLS